MAAEVDIIVNAKDNFSGVLGNFGSILTGIESAINLAADAFRVFTDFAGQGLDAIAQYERLEVTFESLAASQLLMSGGAQSMNEAMALTNGLGAELLQWSQELAIHSPFTQEGVATAFRMAMAYGFNVEESQRLTQAMIDYASATGNTEFAMERIARALGQISAAGKLTAQDINQLVAVGVPVNQILAEHFGVTTQEIIKMRKDGLIPAQEAIEAITVWMETNFAGAGERMTETWSGLISTWEDLKAIGLREYFGAMFDELQPLVVEFYKWFQDEGIQKLRDMGDAIGKITEKIVDLFFNVENKKVFATLFDMKNDNGEEITTYTLKTLDEILGGIQNKIVMFLEQSGVGKLLENIFAVFAAGGIAAGAVGIITSVSTGLSGFIDMSVLLALRIAPLTTIFSTLANIAGTLFSILGPGILIITGLAGVMEVLNQKTDGLVPKMSEFTSKFVEWANDIDWGKLSQDIVDGIESIDWVAVGNEIRINFANILEGLGTIIREVDWMAILSSIGNAFLDIVAGIFQFADWDEVVYYAQIGFQYVLDSIAEWFDGSIFGSIYHTWANIDWEYIGQNIIDGIKAGLTGNLFGLIETARNSFNYWIGTVKSMFGIESPSTLFHDIGTNIVEGLKNGLIAAWTGLVDLIKGLIADFLAPFAPILDLLGIDISGLTGGGGTFTGGVAAGNVGTGGTGTGTSGSTVINIYGVSYWGVSGPGDVNGVYDCPSPHPLVASSANQLVTAGF